MIRVEIVASSVVGQVAQSAVMKSSVLTARTAITSSYVRASPITPTLCTGSSTAKTWAVSRYKPGRLDLVDHDGVGLAQLVEPGLGHFAQQAHGQARAGKRMPPDDLFRQAQLQAQPADFVLEQVAQRLDQLEAQILGQAADVVMQLDRGGRAVGRGAAFDHVGIERSLGQESGAGDLGRFVGKAVDEGVADAAAFFLRIGDAGQGRQKRSSALTTCRSVLKCCENSRMTDFSSSLRKQAVVDQDAAATAGRWPDTSSAATTDESTPPDRPQITRSLPTRRRISSIACSAKSPSRQVPWQWQMSVRKLASTALPSGVCVTSGWNCRP